jgi:hypothetical protein
MWVVGLCTQCFCFKTKQASRKWGSWVILVPLSAFVKSCQIIYIYIYMYVCMYVWYQNCINCKPLMLSVMGFAKLSKEDLICNTNSISEIVGSDWIYSKFELEICMLILHKHLRIWLHIQHACTKGCTSMQFWSTGFGFDSCRIMFCYFFFPPNLGNLFAEHSCGAWWMMMTAILWKAYRNLMMWWASSSAK